MELRLNPHSTPFDLESTLKCGQLFRWEKHGDLWIGPVKDQILEVWQRGNTLTFEGANVDFVRSYFRLDDDLPQIISEISRDSLMRQSVYAFHGLRLARQDPWECLISYICATYKNIPAIKNMILELSRRFGHQIPYKRGLFYSFPEPETLADASIDELRKCKLGFRAKLVRKAAEKVDSNEINLELLKEVDYETAKAELQKVSGVGNKVADCVMLFSLEKLDAFPVDVWVRRIVGIHYSDRFDTPFIRKISSKTSLSRKAYERIGSFARDYYGRYAGYAQEYLFHYARSNGLRGLA
jgi:N-glycosylase/DNA lyase